MTEDTKTPGLLEQADKPVDQSPPPAIREPAPLPEFHAGGALAALIPQTPEEYGRMAKLLIDGGCVPKSYEGASERETRAKLIIGLMKSVEIGVPPITGINGIMIVNNRPSVWGDFAMALVHRDGQLAKMEVQEIGPVPQPGAGLEQWAREYGFRVLMWRKGNDMPFEGKFTVDNAKRSGLWMNTKKQPWINYPADMLFNRARARAMNRGFADALHGLGIVEEERDIAPETEQRQLSSLLADELPAPVEERVVDAEIEETDE